MESYYLECLIRWTGVMHRAPFVHELAGWLGKSKTAVYSALISLEHKGLVERVGKTDKAEDRRFRAVAA